MTDSNDNNTSMIDTPVKRQVYMYTLRNEAPQGEIDVDKLAEFVVSKEPLQRKRPSKNDGMWRLCTNDWAKREGARFIKDENGMWREVKFVNDDDMEPLMGLNPLRQALNEVTQPQPSKKKKPRSRKPTKSSSSD
jgi:hypothetical protein